MLIKPTTDAMKVSAAMNRGDTLQMRGDIGADIIAINIPDSGIGWLPLVEEGDPVQLDADNGQLTANGSTVIQVDKPATANSVGVMILR